MEISQSEDIPHHSPIEEDDLSQYIAYWCLFDIENTHIQLRQQVLPAEGPLASDQHVVRIIMLWWDERLVEVMAKANIRMVEGVRYMDNIRIWLLAIRLGWRWTQDGLRYKSSWRLEEEQAGMSEE
jgi:hypothetical protein